MGGEENLYRMAMRIVGFMNTTFVVFIYGDRYFFDSKAGYAWSPSHYDEAGNTTLEFEWMVIATYFVLGLTLMSASFDVNLEKANYLMNFCIYGAWGAHAVSMTVSALNDYEREWGHLMPYGDIPLLFTLSGVMYYLKSKYQATLKI